MKNPFLDVSRRFTFDELCVRERVKGLRAYLKKKSIIPTDRQEEESDDGR